MYLLDTDITSETRKLDKPNINIGVRDWVAATPPREVYISSVTLFEIELGALLRLRRDTVQGEMLLRWLKEVIRPSFADRVLYFDAAAASQTASMHVPDPAPLCDSMIAGIALVHNLTVVTRNERDFERFGVSLLNPWRNTG